MTIHICETANIINPAPMCGFSPKGLKGKWNKELGANVYALKPWEGAASFPPHVVVNFKEDAPVICPATLTDGIRKTEFVEAVLAAPFDIDGGMSADEVSSRLMASGFPAVLYSSHNHQSDFTILVITEEEDFGGVNVAVKVQSGISADFAAAFDNFKSVMQRPPHLRTVAERKFEESNLLPFVLTALRAKGGVTEEELAKVSLDLHHRVTKYHPPNSGGVFTPRVTEFGVKALHAPAMGRHKLRCILPLAKAFGGGARAWRAALWALATHIGIDAVIDPKAMNLAQALYLPSCAKSNYALRVGPILLNAERPLLDIEPFVPACTGTAQADDADIHDDVTPLGEGETRAAFIAEVNRLMAIKCNHDFARSFYLTFTTSFRAKAFAKRLPDRFVYGGGGERPVEVVCPHAHHHSSGPGGAYIMDAKDTEKGWFWGCHHAHSGAAPGGRRYSTVDQLARALDDGWFTRADVLNPRNFSIKAMAYDLAKKEA